MLQQHRETEMTQDSDTVLHRFDSTIYRRMQPAVVRVLETTRRVWREPLA